MHFALLVLLAVVAVSAQELPTTCYQGNQEVFDDASQKLCAGHACSVSWRAQVDWQAHQLLDFEVRIDDANQCVSNYGRLLSSEVSCTTTGFATADQTTLTVSLAAFFRGGSTAVATWIYRGAGMSCETLARTPALYDAQLVSRTFQLVIGTPIMGTLTLLAAQPLPLSATVIECPLARLPCQCVTGCAYTGLEWAREHSRDSEVWRRAALPSSICGLPPVDWLSKTKTTRAFPVQITNVLAVWVALELNTANFHCAAPAVPGDATVDAAITDIRHAVRSALVDTKTPSKDCSDTREWAHQTWVLAAYNSGAYANYSGPCACQNSECASRYDANYDDSADAPYINSDGVDSNEAGDPRVHAHNSHLPWQWSLRESIFFWTMIALAICVVVLCVMVVSICVLSPVVGPRGFRSLGEDIDQLSANLANGGGAGFGSDGNSGGGFEAHRDDF